MVRSLGLGSASGRRAVIVINMLASLPQHLSRGGTAAQALAIYSP
ncbi:MAG: hypothetical protein QME79_12680 [Bacillota bacterium]|nr:hypothetical protein [Bacillota bacterium]